MTLLPEFLFHILVYGALLLTAAAAIILVVLLIKDARDRHIW